MLNIRGQHIRFDEWEKHALNPLPEAYRSQLPWYVPYRLYAEEKLGVRRRRGRKRARGSRPPMPKALKPGERWSLDFLSDTFGASRRFRILAVNDDCCRENLCLVADTSISGARVARELNALVRIYGKPASIVSDNVLCWEELAG